MKNPVQKVAQRPAETATPVVMAVSMLAGGALDLDTDQIAYLAIIVAFVPAAVTWIVNLRRR